MSKNKTWSPPGWPWELDLLSAVFVIIALTVPFIYFGRDAADEVASVLREQQHVLWAIGIVVLFLMHLVLGVSTFEFITTPFLHLISPVVFALIAYFRAHTIFIEAKIQTPFSGSFGQYAGVAASVFLIALLVARIRKARFMRRFRDIKWDLVHKAPYDGTYWQLLTEFQPLVYPPRTYRACNDGILIEGWFYAMAIPFEMFQSLTAASGLRHATNGRYFASTTRTMIRIELLDNAEPVYISPENRQQFLAYCANHVARLRPQSGHSARSTQHGEQNGRSFAHGPAKSMAFYGHRKEQTSRNE
jgi:hypothetical protein